MSSMLGSLDIQLLQSSQVGDVNEVVSLLERGANVNCKDIGTALSWAEVKGHIQGVTALLDHGAELKRQDDRGLTTLHHAVTHGRVECIKALLDRGAEVDTQGNDGSTPLHDAGMLHGMDTCSASMLSLTAELKWTHRGNDDSTPFQDAAWNGHVQCIKSLLDHGAEVDTQGNDGSTPLQDAAWNGHVHCIKALLDRGAEVDTQGNDGSTPLHVIVR
eukprot:gene14596-biopygen23635